MFCNTFCETFCFQRIVLAITLIQQSSRAVGQLYSTLFFPILPFLCQLVNNRSINPTKEMIRPIPLRYYETYHNESTFIIFQIVFTIFLIIWAYLNTSTSPEFRVIATSRDSKSDCASHPSCRHNESVALTLDRYYLITTSCVFSLTNNIHSSCDPVSFLGCQKVCPVYECNIARNIGDFGDRYIKF